MPELHMLEDIQSLLQAGADLNAPGDHGATLVRTWPWEEEGGGCCWRGMGPDSGLGGLPVATHCRCQWVQRGSRPFAGTPGQPERQRPRWLGAAARRSLLGPGERGLEQLGQLGRQWPCSSGAFSSLGSLAHRCTWWSCSWHMAPTSMGSP